MAEEKESKKESKYINLCNTNEWKSFYEKNNMGTQPKIPDELVNSDNKNSAIEKLRNILLQAAEHSWEMEEKLIKKINSDNNNGYILYQFNSGNIESNIKPTLDWSSVFGYLKNNNNTIFQYWKEVLKVVSSRSFIDELNGVMTKKVAYLNKKLANQASNAKTAAPKFRKFFKSVKVVIDDNVRPVFNFDKEIELSDDVNKVVKELQDSYISTFITILEDNSISGINKDNKEEIKEQIRNEIKDIYTKAYKRSLLAARAKQHEKFEEINKEITDIIISEGTVEINGNKKLTYSSNKKNRLIEERMFGPRNSYSREIKIDRTNITFLITGQGITLQLPQEGDKKLSPLDTISTKNISEDQEFIKDLVNTICNIIASHTDLDSVDKDAGIYDVRFNNRLNLLLTIHFKKYKDKYDINEDKKNIGVYKMYLNSLFGEAGSKNRSSTIQGTLGEFITASLLAIVIDGVPLTEKAIKESNFQNDISAVYVNGQEVNQAGQQAHADIIVKIDGNNIGIQVKQYNSSDVNKNSQSFYKDDINIFGEKSLRIDGLGRYFTTIGDSRDTEKMDASKYAQAAVQYLRELSLYHSNSEQYIDVSELLYPHILRFARIQDDLEIGVKKAEELTYNNFYVYNFALVPTSQILSQMIINLDKEIEKSESSPHDLFTLKPIRAESGSNYVFKEEKENSCPLILYKTDNNNDYKRIDGQLNFVGLTVNPSKWYNFEGF